MKSSLSSPITAISAPVASLRMSFSLSAIVETPAGVENRPLPNETRPEAVIRKRCPFRTTRPLLVQPLLALSARTPTFIVKKVGAGAVVVGWGSAGREPEFTGSDWLFFADGRKGGLF
jgi:hypothetical protein